MPARMRIRVLLPAPFSPTTAWLDPDRTEKDTLSGAAMPNKCLPRPPNRISWPDDLTAGQLPLGVPDSAST